ncbi:MAG: F0F1 ATP synthase subunit epsilon [Blastocatellia bacterium]|nr:F0F1 ATP synthase subunit epsilon [Blastocatellia bacterium]
MLKLEIVTPEKRVLDAEVDSVTVTTATGEAAILPNHAPLISALKPGILSYSAKGSTDRLAVSGGFVEVSDNSVTVLADTAESAAEIDVAQARSDKDAADKALAAVATASLTETEAARDAVEAASARLQLAGGR